jgi:hypothetical protein
MIIKAIKKFDAISEYDKKAYSDKDQTQVANGIKFYRLIITI